MSAPLAAAHAVALEVIARISPWVDRAEIAGSIRRQREQVKDIDIVVQPSAIFDGLFADAGRRYAIPEIRELAAMMGHLSKGGERYIQVQDVLGSGLTLELWLVTPPAEWGVIFAIRTGPAEFSEYLVTKIKGRMWRCEAGHVVDMQRLPVPCPEEADFFAAAQVACIPPEQRGPVYKARPI